MSIIETNKQNKALKSKWVWAILGLFATIFIVNYGFFSVALSTSSGLVTEEYYKYGLQQNKFDKQYRQQAARGWNVQLIMDESWAIHEASMVKLIVTDQYSQVISGGHAELTAYRPSDAKADVLKQLNEVGQSGVYQAEITLPIQGVWDMNLLFSVGDDKHMLNQRITIAGEGNAELSTLEKVVNFITPL